ncbi:MAG: DNA-protecting protein DprA [Clostridia bacterium]|nr:DNA-protecting protein DprA [Clostridia bacterium]
MNEIQYWIWLSRIEKLGSIKTQKLLEIYGVPKNIWNATKEELLKIEGIGEETTKQILKEEYRKGLEKYEIYMKQNNIELIHIYDKYYPEKLKTIYDKPIVLYIKGNKSILNEFSLAIIGCRDHTKYGEIVAKNISYQISKNNIVTISGLARGIDSIAHKETLKAKGKTIAVIGSGVDNIYPEENKELAKEIIKNGGAIISEYVIGTKPQKMNFPARNRIISGMSNGVVVIEAKKKSGTMITVDFALEQGKEVFAIPGNILSQNSEGTNELIKQGAKLVTNIEDILEEF